MNRFVISSQPLFLGQKQHPPVASPVVVSKSKQTVNGISPKYLKLSWKNII